MKHLEEAGIFAKQKINFNPPDTIQEMVASNNILFLALNNGSLLRIPLQRAEEQKSYDIPLGAGDRISGIFLDSTAQHLLISSTAGDLFYLHQKMQSPKPLHKFKGNVISAVGWNGVMSSDSTTAFIVLGTSRGILLETEILANGTVQYIKQLYSLPGEERQAITDVRLERSDGDGRWALLLLDTTHLRPFAGSIALPPSSSWLDTNTPLLQPLFQNPGRIHTLDTEGSGWGSPSSLAVYPGAPGEPPTLFGWLASPGVAFGKIDPSAEDPYKIVVQEALIPHPDVNGRAEAPLSLALTEHHLLLLYRDRFVAISLLNEKITYEDLLGNKFGKLFGMSRDPVSGLIWVFTDRSVLKYRSVDEARYVWKFYLEKGDYSQARQFAKGNKKNLDRVLGEEGQKLLDEKKFVAAAELLAMTEEPFEETALRFVRANATDGLRVFLARKADQLHPREKTAQTMLVLWLLELELTALGEAKSGATPGLLPQPAFSAFDQNRYRTLRDQFRLFLGKPNVLECLKCNSEAVYQMMQSHGDIDSLIYFAELMGDSDRVIDLYIQQELHDEALHVLKRQGDPRLYYKFSGSLMSRVAGKLVEAWLSLGPRLKPKLLLPAMFQCDKNQNDAEELIRYLEFCLWNLRSTEPAIHNYLVSLYARFHPDKLLPYLKSQGMEQGGVPYDIKYALRLAKEKSLVAASVFLYSVLGLDEEAVELALSQSVEEAKAVVQSLTARRPNHEELRHKLWLRIARHIVEKEHNMEKCMGLLAEADGALRIQDVLPFFPDFVTIDHFKDSLCACLKEHSGRIQELQKEMREATEVAQDIRKDMARARNQSQVVRVEDPCVSCSEPALSRPVYVFPCGHRFHADCIQQEVGGCLGEEVSSQLASLQQQLSAVLSSATHPDPGPGVRGGGDALSVDSMSLGAAISKQEQQLRTEIDDILASECPWCGEIIISTITKPFHSPSAYLRQLKSWDLTKAGK